MDLREAIALVVEGHSVDDIVAELLERMTPIDYWSHLKGSAQPKVGKVTGKITRGRGAVLNPGGVKKAIQAVPKEKLIRFGRPGFGPKRF